MRKERADTPFVRTLLSFIYAAAYAIALCAHTCSGSVPGRASTGRVW